MRNLYPKLNSGTGPAFKWNNGIGNRKVAITSAQPFPDPFLIDANQPALALCNLPISNFWEFKRSIRSGFSGKEIMD